MIDIKKVIGGSEYNTATARLLASWDNGLDEKDKNFVLEGLYINRPGNYFLYCKGGARTKYNKINPNKPWSMGEWIIPLNLESAKDWAKNHLSVVDCDGIFHNDNFERASKTFSLLPLTVSKIEKLAVEKDISYSDVIDAILQKVDDNTVLFKKQLSDKPKKIKRTFSLSLFTTKKIKKITESSKHNGIKFSDVIDQTVENVNTL